jgi:plasmid maintenance system antidote protein VapI
MTRMYNPPHPGETLKEDVLPALGLRLKPPSSSACRVWRCRE